jgi:predicted DNA binding protein
MMDHQYSVGTETPTPANATRSLLVEYDCANSISESLISRGFIPEKPVWIHDGFEHWSVIADQDRQTLDANLDGVREEMSADIEIQQLISDDRASQGLFRTDLLTNRQRELFELARECGYYTWPRETSASELAERVDISKATLIEHLRKAEAKLLNSIP